jgi:predicted DNA-binding transcriptional regulator AlpA
VSGRPYPPDFCDLEEISYLTSMGKSTFLNRVADGTLPQGVKIGNKRLWSRLRVLEAIEAQSSRAANVGDDGEIDTWADVA